MVARAPFLQSRYSAYYHRDVPPEDDEMTHVGPGTPCGEYFRRFWHPVAVSEEMKDLPLRIRILGEDLVAFRDGRGEVGLLELHCSHRGTSLEFGQVSERGIRCCYHGWLFDVDGRVLETPGEPVESTLKERLCHGAYPTREYGGLVFAYMGPPEKMPPFPAFDRCVAPGFYMRSGRKTYIPCNWLQAQDNAMDPAHTVFLHTRISGAQFRSKAFGLLGVVEWVGTPAGMAYVQTRRVGDNVWVRLHEVNPPNIRHVVTTSEDGSEPHRTVSVGIRWNVPIDDTGIMTFLLSCIKEGEEERLGSVVDSERVDIWEGTGGLEASRPYEIRQRNPVDYDAFVGQRPIAIHALEHLVTTDRGVIMFRNMVRQGIQAVQRGEAPPFLHLKEGKPVPSVSNNTVLHLPPASTPGEDQELLLETGRKVAQECIREPGGLLV